MAETWTLPKGTSLRVVSKTYFTHPWNQVTVLTGYEKMFHNQEALTIVLLFLFW